MALGVTVGDVMSSPVETVGRDATALSVARRLVEGSIGSLVVVDGDDPVGIVTDTDLIEIMVEGGDPGERTVESIMSAPPVTVTPDREVVDAVASFREHGISKLPVAEAGELVGIVTTRDVANYVPQVVRRQWVTEQRPSVEHRFRVRPSTAYEREDWSFESRSSAEAGVAVGDRVEFSKTVDEEDVRSFAAASGDTNRLHLDDEYAEGTRFGGRIVHGTLVAGLISAALARLPGLTIYLSQDLSFLGPVRIGTRLTATCEVVESMGRDRYVLTTDVHDADGEQVLEGEAVVLVDAHPDDHDAEREPVSGE